MTIIEYINENFSRNGNYIRYLEKRLEKEGENLFLNLWTERWEFMFGKRYYLIEEYINDLTKRIIINHVFKNCELENKDILVEKIIELDKEFKKKTLELKKCLTQYSGWENSDVMEHYSRNMIKNNNNWFYFRIAPERMKDWGITEEDLL
jgi:hypothetical protein